MKFQINKLRIIEEVTYVTIPPHASLYFSKCLIAHIKKVHPYISHARVCNFSILNNQEIFTFHLLVFVIFLYWTTRKFLQYMYKDTQFTDFWTLIRVLWLITCNAFQHDIFACTWLIENFQLCTCLFKRAHMIYRAYIFGTFSNLNNNHIFNSISYYAEVIFQLHSKILTNHSINAETLKL